MSNPTEQTAVIASNFSIESKPSLTAFIIPISSDTGIKAPDRPPTDELAISPPFLTASLSIARAAVVPKPPTLSKPIASKTCATLSPITGVGANDRSTIPHVEPVLSDASAAIS